MNRLLLPLLLLASLQLFGQENQDIFLDVPNRFNNTLLNHSIAQEAKQKDIVDALLKDIKRSSRKNDDDPLQETSHVQSGKSIAICLDTTNIAGNFGVVNDLMCSALQFGSITISDNCITYTSIAGVPVGRDTMCVDLCDRDNGCTQYIFPLEVRNSMPLPFLEDFATSEVLPNEAIWQNNDVFINKTMGINPPSIGIATFDGIDKNGRPYYGGHGKSDMLTSTYLDLDAFSPTDDVYFSFWIQPEGFGDRPEEIDSLVLEFRDVNGEWIRQMKFDGITNGTPSTEKMPFSFHSIHLDNPNFLYNGFQFRFTNYSTNTGAIDLWHLDYIAINDNRSPSESFNDLAFTRVPDPIIKEYSSIPWKHFLAAPDILRDSFTVEMYNHFDKSVIAVSSNYFPSERVTNTFPLTSFQPLLDPGQDNIDAQTQLQLTNDIDNFSSFQSNMINNYIGEDSLIFRIDYSFDQDDEEREALLNNVVSRTTVFDNYFSYDDGSAETNIIAQNTGTEIGVEFMAYTEDTIRAVAISFIQVDGLDLTKELFNLKVYIDTLDQDPDFENILLKPFLANTVFDSLQGFSTYVLTDQITEDPIAVAVPANTRFYIGLQSASTNEIPIGFDRNSLDGASKNFVALSTGWFPFPTTHQGAVMIRPILGDTFPQSTNTVSIATPDPLTDIIQVYPNPTKGILNFISEAVPFFDLQYDAFNIMGQNIKSGYLQNELDFSELVDGIYFLKIRNRKTDELYHHKFMLLR